MLYYYSFIGNSYGCLFAKHKFLHEVCIYAVECSSQISPSLLQSQA